MRVSRRVAVLVRDVNDQIQVVNVTTDVMQTSGPPKIDRATVETAALAEIAGGRVVGVLIARLKGDLRGSIAWAREMETA